MTQVLYTSPYVPAEWIAAHGLEPVRVTPARAPCVGRASSLACRAGTHDPSTDSGQALRTPTGALQTYPAALDRQGVCPFVRNFVADALARSGPAALVMTTVCDQMRRAFDVVTGAGAVPAFLLNVPSTWQSVAVRRLYLDELDRLSGFLVRAGGVRPSDGQLIDIMIARESEPHGLKPILPVATRGLRTHPTILVALVGGPLCQEDIAILDLVAEFGGYVVLDATESGAAGTRRRFDRRRLREEPLLELADAYLDGIHDVARRPNDEFYAWLLRELAASDARAVIVYRHLWCDLWHAEVERLREKSGLPVLDLDTGDGDAIGSGRTRTRLGAFMEMLT
ncbi:MAG: 2-hydroxyacyl-CoA dehydratase [Sedimentisphaerales bacterium]|nr:2-hydroxyacyl-CoA dehydratase [Sedimentisphaerales bacterium]